MTAGYEITVAISYLYSALTTVRAYRDDAHNDDERMKYQDALEDIGECIGILDRISEID